MKHETSELIAQSIELIINYFDQIKSKRNTDEWVNFMLANVTVLYYNPYVPKKVIYFWHFFLRVS